MDNSHSSLWEIHGFTDVLVLHSNVGASLLAMVVNDDAGYLNTRIIWTFFASRLASARGMHQHSKRLNVVYVSNGW